jgi:hypothetical protein
MKMRMKLRVLVAAGSVGTAVVAAYAGSGMKKTAETCADDNECSRGHCYQKQNGDKVCVDCSSSDISNYRGQIQRYCKEEPRKCDNIPRTEEAAEDYFKTRMDNADRCITARDRENRECWNGGDEGHRQAVDEAQQSRKNCYDELNTRKGNGGIYTCSDSTYSSRANDVDNHCGAYGRACDDWSKDDKQVNCSDIEDAMNKAAKCVSAVEWLDSDCLPRLSSRRESQFGKAKKAHDACKEVLEFKKDKKLCK